MSGLEFNFTYADGTSWEQITAFETAGLMWSDYLTDNMTVNIHVEMTEVLPDNVIGGALPAMMSDVSYADFRDAYENDITSGRDRNYFNSLSLKNERGKEKFDARVNLGAETYLEDSSSLNMTRANAKALGMIAGDESSLDGYILMNDLEDASVNWNYDADLNKESSLDFLSVAVHEIGHVLGFVSGLDKYEGMRFADTESLMNHFNQDLEAVDKYTESVVDYANPLDLFRYSQESLNAGEAHNVIEMSIGTQAYFGPAKLWDRFATGKEQNLDGDGFQASHWKQRDNDSQVLGIMDPLMKLGTIRRISDRDLKAMDVIGYDTNHRADNMINMVSVETNWRPVSGYGTSIDTLEYRAKEHIAKSLDSSGQASWIDWLRENQPDLVSAITVDRTNTVQDMIANSKIYEGRRTRRDGSWQEAYFMEFSWQEFNLESIAFITPVVIDLDSPINSKEFVASVALNNSKNKDIEFNNNLEVVAVELNLLELKEAIKVQAKNSDIDDLLLNDKSLSIKDGFNFDEELLVMPLA